VNLIRSHSTLKIGLVVTSKRKRPKQFFKNNKTEHVGWGFIDFEEHSPKDVNSEGEGCNCNPRAEHFEIKLGIEERRWGWIGGLVQNIFVHGFCGQAQ